MDDTVVMMAEKSELHRRLWLRSELMVAISIKVLIPLAFGRFFLSKSVFSFSIDKSNGHESGSRHHASFDSLNDSSLQDKAK
jgi:hypothetical protein